MDILLGLICDMAYKKSDHVATFLSNNTINLYQLHLNHISYNYRTVCNDACQVKYPFYNRVLLII